MIFYVWAFAHMCTYVHVCAYVSFGTLAKYWPVPLQDLCRCLTGKNFTGDVMLYGLGNFHVNQPHRNIMV